MAKDVWFSKEPGRYAPPQTVNWVISDNIDYFAISTDDKATAISEYIAYDTLTPPNPFIAVTQDGNGQVVYDGGFPKFYNAAAPTGDLTGSITIEFKATCAGTSDPEANLYYYNAFSDLPCLIAAGDKLVYDMWQNSNDARVGLDAVTNQPMTSKYYSMRDWGKDYNDASVPYGLYDQNGVWSHPAVDLAGRATNKWYHREIDLTKCAGYTFVRWSLAMEGEKAGDFAVRFRNIQIIDKNGNLKYTLFKDSIKLPGNTSAEAGASGYSNLVKQLFDPRPPLSAAFKYLFNAFNWCANPAKVNAGNRKVLILGDRPGADVNYSVKDSVGNAGFGKSIAAICSLTGFTATVKTHEDYAGSLLNPTQAELNGYPLVVVFSSGSGGAGPITEAACDALAAYRAGGGGLIIITDHGPVLDTLDAAKAGAPNDSNQFFATANKVATRFGAWFSGNFDRTPVNVGFLRTNYGDHPLYAGMANNENIAAGFSESRVMVPSVTKYTKASPPPPLSFPVIGRYPVLVTMKHKDATVESFSVVFVMGSTKYLKWTAVGGTEITSTDLGWGWQPDVELVMDTIGLGDCAGSIYHNTTKIGEFSCTDLGGPVITWYSGSSYALKTLDGDKLRAVLESGLSYTADLAIKRVNFDATKGRSMAAIEQQLRSGSWNLPSPVPRINQGGDIVRSLLPVDATIDGFGKVLDFSTPAQNIRLLREFAAGNFPLFDVNAMAYATTAAAQQAMSTMKPPTLLDVFNTWPRFSNANWYPTQADIPAGSEALSWAWDEASGSPKSTVNSATYLGLVSKEKVENFVLESTFSSSANDDDVIGYIVAARYTDKLETLSLLVNPGGWAAYKGMALVYNYQLPGTKTLAMNDQLTQWAANGGLGYWPGKDIRVGMVRRGANLAFYATDWGDPNGPRKAEFQFDMNSDPILAGLLGAQSYGYSMISQANSIFKNVRFVGGVLYDVVVDVQANAVYRYNGTAWVVVPGLKPASIYGTRRKMISQDTLQEFYINADGTITKLTDPAPMVEFTPPNAAMFLNPVTGEAAVPKYRVYSAEYGWASLPANLTMYYYRTMHFPAGTYIFMAIVDDQLEISIDGVVKGTISGGFSAGSTVPKLEVTVTAGDHKVRLMNKNVPANTPGYFLLKIFNKADGSVFHEPTPGTWQTVDVIG